MTEISHWVWCAVGVVGFIVLVILVKFLFGAIQKLRSKQRLRKWETKTSGSETLIVHCPPWAKTLPSPSPFVMKVLTYLRIAGIPYELDHTDVFGGKGKTPWISVNGENIADSEFIIAFLTKKFGKNLKGNYSDEQLAVATAVRIMLDEHLFWGMALERFVFGSPDKMARVFHLPRLVVMILKRMIRGRAEGQGIGVHTESDIIEIMSKDIRTVSKILGNKKFILGDEPCSEDAGIFGQLSQFFWGLPNNPYEVLLNGECKNLGDYCLRFCWPYTLKNKRS
ncbi:unnamed protein product [Allacma fusca]|uniref:Failed axon connections homolog n=1 Tax=Allacma fusca TaxID=39272 RepID=A0A8J2LT03_9HEXA|nr:unnamed protein product [Allacma fusca]